MTPADPLATTRPPGPRGSIVRAGRASVGRFRRHPSEPDFENTGPARGTLLVFPRLPVHIAQAGRRRVVADPTVIMLYNEGQEYRRRALSPEGDRCDWLAFAPVDVAEALRARGAEPDPLRPFAEPCVRAPAPLLLRARELFAAAAGAPPLALEEGALRLLADALAPRPASASSPAARELAEAAKALLARRFHERLSLSEIGTALGCSPFQLCRAFAAEGGSVRRHQLTLRLHAALERLPECRRDLAALAHDLGFSHHAHFTAHFRRAFGLTPSAWLSRLERRPGGRGRARLANKSGG